MSGRRAYTDAEVEAAIEALSDPGRLEEAQRTVGANAPGIQRILNEALQAADWFGSATRRRCSRRPASPTSTTVRAPCGR